MSLCTGRRLNSIKWKELYVTDEVIDRVNNTSKQEIQQPNIITDGIVFKWEPGVPIDCDIITIKDNETNQQDEVCNKNENTNIVSNTEECITNINEIPEVYENSSSSINIEDNKNQVCNNNISEENENIEDKSKNTKGALTDIENVNDTNIVVEDDNNNCDETKNLETTGIDNIIVENIATDNNNIVVDKIKNKIQSQSNSYNLRRNKEDFSKYIGRVDDDKDYTFLGLGCKDYTFLQKNIEEKV